MDAEASKLQLLEQMIQEKLAAEDIEVQKRREEEAVQHIKSVN